MRSRESKAHHSDIQWANGVSPEYVARQVESRDDHAGDVAPAVYDGKHWASSGSSAAILADDVLMGIVINRVRGKERTHTKKCSQECGFRTCRNCGENQGRMA